MAQIERNLDLKIRCDGETVEVEIFEPVTGLTSRVSNGYSIDEHPEFNADLGDEIYSWVKVWMDLQEEAEAAEKGDSQ